jgi:single-stranded-DNA-specific exonuclease
VVAGETWHEGVIGIVASRLVERYNRPVVMIAGTDGKWKGSGRSVPAFDLHAGLHACAAHLEHFGGHRAAAGLSVDEASVQTFAAAFAAHADAVLTEADLRRATRIDAIVPGAKLGLDLCAELGRLAPFGLGNPGVLLLVDGCELAELSTVGDGKHLRFRVRQRGRDSGSAIAFGMGGEVDRFRSEGRYDVAFRLQENRWNGVRSPQLVVRRVFDAVEGFDSLRDWLAAQWKAGAGAWTPQARAIFEELELGDGARRSLLESATFRALLEQGVELAEAA